ncbi:MULTISPECIES: hydrogenase expression/formation protein HypE [Haloarcula]|uniref:hydrogenase expression/formation protein HypE n=1 Tax=Haloarcula TaxID=2237 RepID=UPI0023EB4A35|nr:hydrogenase expression/formation protein HypE [Halomicroarcula sp. XH51]
MTRTEAEPDAVEETGESAGDATVTAAHGAGTERTRDLLDAVVTDRFGDPATADVGLGALDDGAVVPDSAVRDVDPPAADGDRSPEGSTVVTTDAHVVHPREFPGGDLGRLAVCGTVNDLAAMGATAPLALSSALVVEAGTPVAAVDRLTSSMAAACEEAGCQLRTGDTKVMGSGDVDGIVVTTTGVGRIERGAELAATGVSPGDALLVTGPVGDHGVALLAAREGFEFASPLRSDVRPVNDLVAAAREAGRVTAATDPTRGGVANAVNELAAASEVGLVLDEQSIPVADATRGAAEVLGLDPLTVACEGRMVLAVDAADADAVRDRLRELPGGERAAVVGRAVDDHPGDVVLDTGFGERYLDVPTGERVPRIC